MHLRNTLSCFCLLVLLSSCSEREFAERPEYRVKKRILVDASHDGGAWWFPQTGPYEPKINHQGTVVAAYLRSLGQEVDELDAYATITDSLLEQYSGVIRAGSFGSYSSSALSAYDHFLDRGGSLMLIGEYMRPGEQDMLAEHIGIRFEGWHYGRLDSFAVHPLTAGATSFYYNAGSVIGNTSTNPNIEILGWLDHDPNLPALCMLHHPTAKIICTGDINGLEGLPQPLSESIYDWLFR